MSQMAQTKTIALPTDSEWVDRVRNTAKDNMQRFDNCSQSILAAFMTEFKLEEPLVLRAAGGFFGGMLSSLTCGVHSAGLMVLGLLIGRQRIAEGLDGLFPIVLPAQELVCRLTEGLGSHSCRELTGVDFTDLNQAIAFHGSDGHKKCIARVAKGAELTALFFKELSDRGELFRSDFRRPA